MIFITEQDYKTAAENGIYAHNLEVRVRQCGWDLETAITRPVGYNRRFIKMIRDEHPDILELCEKNGICYNTFRNRVIRQKWDIYKAAITPVNMKYVKKRGINNE